ncbi:MAG: FtsX-like permease family protein [bacterium]|nr:FtsX-like permease family protein [bacterium]
MKENRKKNPPVIAERLLRILTRAESRSYFLGDMEETFNKIFRERGKMPAILWYWYQCIVPVPKYIWNKLKWSLTMYKNYLKIAFRNLNSNKGYSFINIFGLAVGMTCFILLGLYVKYELSIDDFHENADRIYRIGHHMPGWNYRGSVEFAMTSGALAPAMREEFPEVEYSTRIGTNRSPVSYENKHFQQEGIYTDEFFLRMFSFKLLQGDRETALIEPFSIVVTEELSEKLFGSDDPVGKVIVLNNKYDFKVTGVIENPPHNSYMKFDYLYSFATRYSIADWGIDRWGTINYFTYVSLIDQSSPEEFERKLVGLVEKYHQYDSEENKDGYYLQPLRDIYLKSHLNFEMNTNSDMKYIYMFSSIALIVLFIACINYMNLATARSAKRSKEIGIRKTVGAFRIQLIKQFISESFILSAIAVLITIALVVLILPYFRTFVDRQMDFNIISNPGNLIWLIGIFLISGFMSGLYPAFLLSSFKPVNVLKGSLIKSSGRNSLKLRNILVVLQFSITVILIISAIVIQRQVSYIKYGDIGFTRENIVAVRIRDRAEFTIRQKYNTVKEQLMRNNNILDVTYSNWTPVNIGNVSNAEIEGDEGGETIVIPQINSAYIDYNYLDFFDIEIVEGRDFSRSFITDSSNSVIINEAAVRKAGIDNPIGKQFSRHDIPEGRVIGVVKDFHFTSLKLEIEPLMFIVRPNSAHLYMIKINSENTEETLKNIKSVFSRHIKNFVWEYSFLDDRFNNMYKAEQNLGTILVTFSVIAIIIASLGLIGLASYIAEQSTKEIGIRKTLGASLSGLIMHQSREFLLLVLISNMIAWPIGYFLMKSWLEEFVYKAEFDLGIFLLSGAVALLFALLTVSYQSVKAAIANPVDSLRYE